MIYINSNSPIDNIISSFLEIPADTSWTINQESKSADGYTVFCNKLGELIEKFSNIDQDFLNAIALNIPEKFIQLKTPNGENPYNIVDSDSLLHHLAKNFGEFPLTWKIIDECLTHAQENGVEFLSLSIGRDAENDRPEAQGKQILKVLLTNNQKGLALDPIKISVFEKLINPKLYKLPEAYINNNNAKAAHESHKAFFSNKGDTLQTLIRSTEDFDLIFALFNIIENSRTSPSTQQERTKNPVDESNKSALDLAKQFEDPNAKNFNIIADPITGYHKDVYLAISSNSTKKSPKIHDILDDEKFIPFLQIQTKEGINALCKEINEEYIRIFNDSKKDFINGGFEQYKKINDDIRHINEDAANKMLAEFSEKVEINNLLNSNPDASFKPEKIGETANAPKKFVSKYETQKLNSQQPIATKQQDAGPSKNYLPTTSKASHPQDTNLKIGNIYINPNDTIDNIISAFSNNPGASWTIERQINCTSNGFSQFSDKVGSLLEKFANEVSFNIIEKLPKLIYLASPPGASVFNTVGNDSLLHHLAKNYGKSPLTWEVIDKCLTHAQENGVEFLSLSRGWDAKNKRGEAQGKQILKILLDNNPEVELTNPIKISVFEKLINPELYKLPKAYIDNDNAKVAYKSQEAFFSNNGTYNLYNLIEKSTNNKAFKAYIKDLVNKAGTSSELFTTDNNTTSFVNESKKPLSEVKEIIIKRLDNNFYNHFSKAIINKELLNDFCKKINKKYIEFFNSNKTGFIGEEFEEYTKITKVLFQLDQNTTNQMRYEFLTEVGIDNLCSGNMLQQANALKKFVQNYETQNPHIKNTINSQQPIDASLEDVDDKSSSITSKQASGNNHKEFFTEIAEALFPGRPDIANDRMIKGMDKLVNSGLPPEDQNNLLNTQYAQGTLQTAGEIAQVLGASIYGSDLE